MNQPFASLTGAQISASLGITPDQIRILVEAALFPAPDVAVTVFDNATNWAWAISTAATAMAAFTQTALWTALEQTAAHRAPSGQITYPLATVQPFGSWA